MKTIDIKTIEKIERDLLEKVDPHAGYVSKTMMNLKRVLIGSDDDENLANNEVIDFGIYMYITSAKHFIKHFREAVVERLLATNDVVSHETENNSDNDLVCPECGCSDFTTAQCHGCNIIFSIKELKNKSNNQSCCPKCGCNESEYYMGVIRCKGCLSLFIEKEELKNKA